jgi:hypothetical protein
MTDLVYCSYPITPLGIGMKYDPPMWTLDLGRELVRHAIYTPYRDIRDHLQDPRFIRALEGKQELVEKRFRSCECLQLPELLLAPLEQASSYLLAADTPRDAESIIYKDLYVLIRADLFVCDIDLPSSGAAIEQLYAYGFDIGCVTVSTRFLHSPWSIHHSSATAKPSMVVPLVRALLKDEDLLPNLESPPSPEAPVEPPSSGD